MSEERNTHESSAEKQKPPKQTAVWKLYGLGIVGGLIYGYVMVSLFGWGLSQLFDNHAGLATFAFLILVPVGFGGLTATLIPSDQSSFISAIAVTIIFLITCALVYSGMFFCILIAAPLWIIPVMVGWALVKMFRNYIRNRRSQYVFAGLMLALPLMFAPIENYIPAPNWIRDVEDSIIIEGTAQAVWDNITRMDTITPEEQRPSLYHTLGVPRPVRATLDHDGVGGIRVGEFEFGLTFHEIITVWEPNQAVRFDVEVHTNTRDTDILSQIGGRYFDIFEAGYRIEPLDEGRVRLHLSSTYRLSTHFNAYGVLWSDWILHDFQGYVLQTVKSRVEKS